MQYYKHNDYEILSQIREGNDEALNLMFEKYSNLISKIIYKFNLFYDFDDMYQEALLILYKSIQKFDESKNKSFTRYLEQNIERKFISIVTKRRRRSEIFKQNELYIYETMHNVRQNSVYYELLKKEIAKFLTKQEFLVYTLRELKNYSISYIKETTGLGEKNIYNTLHRAKAKIKRHFVN